MSDSLPLYSYKINIHFFKLKYKIRFKIQNIQKNKSLDEGGIHRISQIFIISLDLS